MPSSPPVVATTSHGGGSPRFFTIREREPGWWPLCSRRGTFELTDEPADCRRCFKALDFEQLRIRGEIAHANALRSSYAKQVSDLARCLDKLDSMFTPDFEDRMADAS